MAQTPCFSISPCWFPFAPFPFPFTYLETLLGVIGSRLPWSQVTRKLTSPSSTPPHSLPIPNSQYPRLIVRLTTTTSWPRLLMVQNNTHEMFFEECMNFETHYFRYCRVIPLQSFGSHIRPQPHGLGLNVVLKHHRNTLSKNLTTGWRATRESSWHGSLLTEK